MDIKRIIVVCYANVCRSPVGAAFLESGLSKPFIVSSAGTHAVSGKPAHPAAVSLLAFRGLDIAGHRAMRLNPDLVGEADLVLVMDRGIRREVAGLFPALRGRIWLFGHWRGIVDITDPVKGTGVTCAETVDVIEECATSWIGHLI